MSQRRITPAHVRRARRKRAEAAEDVAPFLRLAAGASPGPPASRLPEESAGRYDAAAAFLRELQRAEEHQRHLAREDAEIAAELREAGIL